MKTASILSLLACTAPAWAQFPGGYDGGPYGGSGSNNNNNGDGYGDGGPFGGNGIGLTTKVRALLSE